MKNLTTFDLMKVALRLALLQSTWSEGSMQTVGLIYCLLPARRKLNPSPQALDQVIRQYQEPFNTHPFLVGAVAGAILRLEEEGKKPREISAFLRGTMGPLAALGDPFFRGALPVFSTIVASLVTMFGGIWAGIITFLAIFNSVHFFVRISGIFVGYREGYNVLAKIAKWMGPHRTALTSHVAAAVTGIVLVSVAHRFGPAHPTWMSLLIGGLGALFALALIRWRLLQGYALPGTLVICLLVGVIL